MPSFDYTCQLGTRQCEKSNNIENYFDSKNCAFHFEFGLNQKEIALTALSDLSIFTPIFSLFGR